MPADDTTGCYRPTGQYTAVRFLGAKGQRCHVLVQLSGLLIDTNIFALLPVPLHFLSQYFLLFSSGQLQLTGCSEECRVASFHVFYRSY